MVSEGTRKFIEAGRDLEGFSLWDKVHGYIYGRWPYHYIGIGKGEHPIAKKLAPLIRLLFPPKEPSTKPKPHSLTMATGTIADGYHGKAMPLDTAKQLVMVNQPIKVPDLEQVIPYVRARAIILENPGHIIALDCPCRKYAENPCLPMDVCLIVGEPFASFVWEHHPDSARWISQEEAVQILEAEDARGHVHHAFFKDAMLGRFYAICNCCECCCGAIRSQRNGSPMLSSSGYLAHIDEDLCIGCDTCVEYCQFGALSIGPGEFALVNIDLCMGCAVCESKCDQGAISIQLAPEKGIPLEIEKLFQAAEAQYRD
ncbi:MAG: 4Fe-4S binding protein [Anaerolineales bacterium]|nr:4Fe-4S binding protein [Anaerolineales bacterium]